MAGRREDWKGRRPGKTQAGGRGGRHCAERAGIPSKVGGSARLLGFADSCGRPRPERRADRTPGVGLQPWVPLARSHAGANRPRWTGSRVRARPCADASLSPSISGSALRADLLSPRHIHPLASLFSARTRRNLCASDHLCSPSRKAFSFPPKPLLGAASRPFCSHSADTQLPALPAASRSPDLEIG